MAARRSRTGCATCRRRKLKCDEIKPVCGNCTKSRRECIPSDGIAFRHEQNAGLNAEAGGDPSLSNFYKYRNEFTAEQLRSFLPVPGPVEWRYVVDPYAEDTDLPARNTSSPQAYQREMASGGLEALSTAAAENQAYQPPVTYADINNFYTGSNVGYSPASGPNQNNNIKFLLNPSSTPAAMIDPNLDDTALNSVTEAAERTVNEAIGPKVGGDDQNEEMQHGLTNEMIRALKEQTA